MFCDGKVTQKSERIITSKLHCSQTAVNTAKVNFMKKL